MSKSLPTAPNLEHLKKQAKDLRKSHRTRNPECCEVLKLLRQFNGLSDSEIFETELSLNEAQMALALEYGFKSWGDLKKHALGRTDNLKYLHIHSGDSAAQSLRNSSVPGDCFAWREIYIEGPAPGGLSDREFSIERAKYLETHGLDPTDILAGRDRKAQTLAEAGKYEEVILWFDSCMYDQTMMIKVIDQASHQNWGDTRFSLICVDQGLGAIPSEELASLMEIRHEITPEEITLAQNAWKAFTSANPADIEKLLKGNTSALPFLAAALYRHLEQYPSMRNGLNRTERQILQAVANGASKLGPIFAAATGDVEERPFMGDTSCWGIIQNLAESKVPVLKVTGPDFSELTDFNPDDYEPPKNLKRWDVSITDTGRDVLAGKQDYIKLNGIDKWLGGVHLQGPESQWRWNEDSRKLVRTSDSKPVAEKSKTKNQGAKKMKMDKMEFKWNGHRFDTFSQIVVAAGKLLGKELEYGDVSCYSTSNFAPSIEINESCTDWWHMNKKPAMDLVGKAAGLKFEKIPLPKGQNPEWTDEQFDAHKKECSVLIQKAIDSGDIVITGSGWSNSKGKPFYPWCFWGIVTEALDDGTILGIGINNRDDNEVKWLGECWTVSITNQEENSNDLNKELLERVLTRIRGDEAPYLSDNEMAYGLDAMDKWIGKMKAEHFCDDCFKAAPDREWTCARGSALTMFQGAIDSSAFLKHNMDDDTIAGHYDRIAELLEPALTEDSETAYQKFIGNREKQIKHAETVLEPVKEELAKVADEIEKMLEGHRA